MKKKTRIVELVISDDSELTIDAISLVANPALEESFVFFGKEKNNLTFAKVDEEKRMLISPALIPNKQIYRYDANTDTNYYVWFSKETVRQASELYLKHNNHHKATYEHSDRVSGVLTVESWIKEGDKDKSSYYGFDLPIGTWFVKMSITNDDIWKEIKDGSVRGLSIEGYFIDRLETMSKTITDEQIKTAYKELQAEGKVKVELNSVKELEKYSKLGEAKIKSTKGTIARVKKEQEDLRQHNEDLEKLNDKLENDLKGFENNAKKLGVEFKSIPAYTKAKDLSSSLVKQAEFGYQVLKGKK